MVQILKKSSTSLFLSGFFSRRLFHASTRIFLRRGRKFTLEAAKQTQIHHEILEMNETCTFLWTLRILGPSNGRVWTYIAGRGDFGSSKWRHFWGVRILRECFFLPRPPKQPDTTNATGKPFFGGEGIVASKLNQPTLVVSCCFCGSKEWFQKGSGSLWTSRT